MSLIRGVNGLCPCPRCLIQADKQGDPSGRAPARTAANTQATINRARQQKFLKDKEEILKNAGLRDVDVLILLSFVSYPCSRRPRQNVFWKFGCSDPHGALSFDRLHTLPGGLFRHHLWPDLLTHIQSLGREAGVMINATYVPSFMFFRGPIYSEEKCQKRPAVEGLESFW